MKHAAALLLPSLALLACAPAAGRANTTDTEHSVIAAQTVDLQYLREEEKLARDVYLALFERWQMPVFSNIASSEQRHLDIATAQLERKGLADVGYSDSPGAFKNDSLRALYKEFVDKGSTSLVAALEVGATIEDLDIRDLDAMIAREPDPSLRASLEKLLCASGNHMRAFTSQLEGQGLTYRAQYISHARLEEVLAREHQRCGPMGKGHGQMGKGHMGKGHMGKGHMGKGRMGKAGRMGKGRMGKGRIGKGRMDQGGQYAAAGKDAHVGVQVVKLPANANGTTSATKDKQVSLLLDTPSLKIATITLRNGAVLPSHATPMPVTVQSLGGTGVVRVGGEDYALHPGVLISLAPNEEHAVIPDKGGDLVVLVHHVKVPKRKAGDI